jgi:hypothetical protein
MKKFKILLTPLAINQVEIFVEYYNSCVPKLGDKLVKKIDLAFIALKTNPYYQIRYSNIRCYPIPKLAYMIHFVVEDNIVSILAIISTHQNPNETWVGDEE